MRSLLLRITALAFLIVTFSLPCRAAETGAQSVDSSWIKAMKANDLEAVLKTYAPDAVVWLPQAKEARGEKGDSLCVRRIAVREHCQGGRLVGNGVSDHGQGFRWLGQVLSYAGAQVGRQSSCDDRAIHRHR
ncbi:hypothetical protein ACFS07_16700 [Undibacterium arcticum]